MTKYLPATILWRQIEWRFYQCRISKKRKTFFYKFIKPPKTERGDYIQGDSWCEELGLSRYEFKKAFRVIGQDWNSFMDMRMYEEEYGTNERFMGKMYCSVYNRLEKKTYFYRDEDMVKAVIMDNDFEHCFDFEKELFKRLSNME